MSERTLRVELVVHVPEGMEVPAMVLHVGGPSGYAAAPPALSAPAPSPAPGTPAPTGPVALPASALGTWRATSEARARHYPQAPDGGQHDQWKREIAIVCWRLLAGPDVPLARAWFDLDGDAPSAPPPVFPLHSDLAQACQRLGLARLVHAALGFGASELAEASTPAEAPAGGAFRLLAGAVAPGVSVPRAEGRLNGNELARRIAAEHASASELGVMSAMEHHERMRKEWSGPGPYQHMGADEYRALAALAPKEVDVLARPDLSGCPPLEPLRFAFDASTLGPTPAPRRTPATGAAIPAPPPPPPAPAPEGE